MVYDVKIQMTYDRSLNYIRQQNGLDKIHRLEISNMGTETVRDLKLKLSFVPDFAESWVRSIGEIAAGASMVIEEPDLIMKPEELLSYNETLEGHILAELLTSDAEETLICKEAFPLTVLPYDLWLSTDHPELLAVFVTPNDRRVLEILARAGERLGTQEGIVFQGYGGSSSRKEILRQMQVIYEVIQEEKITYCYPPANWDRGQRVRMPGFTLANKLGCCIDMAVLYAACLEAARLNPMVMILKGHAVAGCWLKPTNFDKAVVSDRESVETRSFNKLGELAMVECTLMDNYAHSTGFEYAVNCTDKLYPNFEYVVDVARARSGGIRPMPLKEIHDEMMGGDREDSPAENETDNDSFYEEDDELDILPEAEEQQLTKLAYWERKILDLGLRNALLSMPMGRRCLPVMAGMEDMGRLTEGLQEGHSYHLLAAPEELDGQVPSVKDMDGQAAVIRGFQELTLRDFQNSRLRLLLKDRECLPALKSLYRQAHTFMEETGANALYLAAGLLKWRQKGDSAAHYAPLVLIPVNLERKTANTDYTLSLREDEWQMNRTLLEMLKQKFGITWKYQMETVPVNEEGHPAYKALFTTVRQAVKLKEGWDVLERTFLGIFSFGQFMLWKDLHEHGEAFSRQPLVASLMEGHLTWEPEQVFMTREQLDRQVSPAELVTPVSADGSQLVAIRAAAEGKSFVMHGPPGTGKSQTITNMIANALYQGKTVLFLAKKMPALEVVQRRLEAIGLGPFCLELHAHKASKQHVLRQFEETLKLTDGEPAPLYERTAEQIMEKREELRSLIELLHRPSRCGLSLYELMGMLEKVQEAPDGVVYDKASAMLVTAEELADWKRQLQILQEVAVQLSDIPSHPLRRIRTQQFQRHEKLRLRQQLQDWFTYDQQLRSDIEQMKEMVGITACEAADLREYAAMADALAHAVIYPAYMAELMAEGEDFEAIETAWQKNREAQALLEEVDAVYDRAVLKADLQTAREGWRMAGDSDSRGARMQRSMALRLLKRYAHQPETLTLEAVPDQLEQLMLYQTRYREAGKGSRLEQKLLQNGQKVDWPLWQKADRRMRQVMDRLDLLAIDEDSYVVLQDYVEGQALTPDDHFREDRKYYAGIRQQYEALKRCTETIIGMTDYACEAGTDSISDIMLDEQWQQTLRDWMAHYQELDAWCCYRQECVQAEEMGLAPVVEALEQGLAPEQLMPAFYKGWAGTYVKYTIEKNPQLQYFTGLSYERILEKYRQLCSDFTELSRKEIRARLLARIPDREAGSSSKDLSILQKAIMGGGSKLTIRQLFAKMPEAVRLLTPCMLMSPASVAQFIDPSFPKFDLVIMDEASQLPTCEAVGAIARGVSVVIAGDEQQLPPTNFFKKRDSGEDIELDDLESILDDALALNMPQCYLSWHYRSAHESLITFSNVKYYEQALRTFPSADDRIPAVRYVNVKGLYDRAGTRTNRREAMKVIEEMKQRVLTQPERSLGVITFNIQQRGMIEELWASALDQDQALAAAVREMKEPVFIKNLENIQGDERDVIIFSLGYGPDESGQMRMNFGPVNQNGGHRRLNVAVTRARQEMLVYASFEPAELHTTERSAQGIRDLKVFLEYAKEGSRTLDCRETEAVLAREQVNRQIAKRLREKGYAADIHVGTSQFRIDVAIRDPERPGQYLLGVVFDDDASALEDTISDRAILQKDVLRRMGWHLMNIWLLDWWEDSETQLQRIEAAIEALRGQPAETAIQS